MHLISELRFYWKGDMGILFYHVTLLDHIIKDACDLVSENSST